MARIEISYQEYTHLKQQIENLEKELIDKDKLIKKYQHTIDQIKEYVDDIPLKDKVFKPIKVNKTLSNILRLTEQNYEV